MRKGSWTKLAVAAVLGAGAVAQGAIVINEIDSDSVNVPTTDHAEFIELYSTTGGVTPLDGLVLVLFNGNGEVSYRALDLDGFSTDATGFFLIGSNSIPGADDYTLLGAGNVLQNGQDAVALYTGDATAFPNGTAPTTTNLVDVIVYGTGDPDDAELLAALGQTVQYDEFGGPTGGATDSLARFPNATGAFVATVPTPGLPNVPEPAAVGLVGLVGGLAAARRRRV